MKRFVSLLLVAILVISSMSVAAFAAQVEAEAGQTVTVPVTVTGPVGSFKIQIGGTEYLTVTDISAEGATINHAKGIVVWAKNTEENFKSYTINVTVQVNSTATVDKEYPLNVSVKQAAKAVDVAEDTNDEVADGWVDCSISASGSVKITCKHNHVGEVTTPATCGVDGVMTYTCTKCGHNYTETIPATGEHDWDDGEVFFKPTCTEPGTMKYTCKVCDQGYSEDIPATGHTYGEWATVEEASCEKAGKQTRTCTVCGHEESKEIPATGHAWGEWKVTKDATCTADGVMTRTCDNCGETETKAVKAEGHNYKDGVCTKCGAKDPNYKQPSQDGEKDDVPATGDISTTVYMTGVIILAVIACAVAFVIKRRNVR